MQLCFISEHKVLNSSVWSCVFQSKSTCWSWETLGTALFQSDDQFTGRHPLPTPPMPLPPFTCPFSMSLLLPWELMLWAKKKMKGKAETL